MRHDVTFIVSERLQQIANLFPKFSCFNHYINQSKFCNKTSRTEKIKTSRGRLVYFSSYNISVIILDKIKEQFINVTLVTFESKSNMAFVYWRWGKYGANFFECLSKEAFYISKWLRFGIMKAGWWALLILDIKV